MVKGQLRYNISDWRQLSQCLSNLSNDLHIRVRDSVDERLKGTIIEVFHDELGVLFSYLVDATGDLIDVRSSNSLDLTVAQVLDELSRFGFLVTFDRKAYLSENQMNYLKTLQGLGFDKIRILYVHTFVSKTGMTVSSPHVVAFNIEKNPGWLDIEYTASQEEFVTALDNGSAANLDDISKTKLYRWDWLDYVANIQDVLDDNEPSDSRYGKSTYSREEIDEMMEVINASVSDNTADIETLKSVAIVSKEGNPIVLTSEDLINGNIIHCECQTYYQSASGIHTELISNTSGGHIVVDYSLFNYTNIAQDEQCATILVITDTIKQVNIDSTENITSKVIAYQEDVDEFKTDVNYQLDIINKALPTFAKKSDISNVYVYRGSVSSSELPTDLSENEIGYVYNITNDSKYGPAGTNVAWEGSEWDVLSGTFDLSSIYDDAGRILASDFVIVEEQNSGQSNTVTYSDTVNLGSVSLPLNQRYVELKSNNSFRNIDGDVGISNLTVRFSMGGDLDQPGQLYLYLYSELDCKGEYVSLNTSITNRDEDTKVIEKSITNIPFIPKSYCITLQTSSSENGGYACYGMVYITSQTNYTNAPESVETVKLSQVAKRLITLEGKVNDSDITDNIILDESKFDITDKYSNSYYLLRHTDTNFMGLFNPNKDYRESEVVYVEGDNITYYVFNIDYIGDGIKQIEELVDDGTVSTTQFDEKPEEAVVTYSVVDHKGNVLLTSQSATLTEDQIEAINEVDELKQQIDELKTTVANIEQIARSAHKAFTYLDYSALVTALNAAGNDMMSIGDNIYLQVSDIPDMWVAGIADTSRQYKFVSDDQFVEDVDANVGGLQVGYYYLCMMETDLSDYATLDSVEEIKEEVGEVNDHLEEI